MVLSCCWGRAVLPELSESIAAIDERVALFCPDLESLRLGPMTGPEIVALTESVEPWVLPDELVLFLTSSGVAPFETDLSFEGASRRYECSKTGYKPPGSVRIGCEWYPPNPDWCVMLGREAAPTGSVVVWEAEDAELFGQVPFPSLRSAMWVWAEAIRLAPHYGFPASALNRARFDGEPVAVGARCCSTRAASPSTKSQPGDPAPLPWGLDRTRVIDVPNPTDSFTRRNARTDRHHRQRRSSPPPARFARHLHSLLFGALQRRQQSLHRVGPIRGQPVVRPTNPLVRPSDSSRATPQQIHTEIRFLEGARSVKPTTSDLGPVRHHDDTRAVGPYLRVGHAPIPNGSRSTAIASSSRTIL